MGVGGRLEQYNGMSPRVRKSICIISIENVNLVFWGYLVAFGRESQAQPRYYPNFDCFRMVFLAFRGPEVMATEVGTTVPPCDLEFGWAISFAYSGRIGVSQRVVGWSAFCSFGPMEDGGFSRSC